MRARDLWRWPCFLSFQTENLDDLGENISEKTSNVTLIDLAGSERADSADTNGERLKVGLHVLLFLGAIFSIPSFLKIYSAFIQRIWTWSRASEIAK